MSHHVHSTFPSPQQGDGPLLQAYAKVICVAAETISTYCALNDKAHPSFNPRADSFTIPFTAPRCVQLARENLIAAAARIQHLATEPAEYLSNLTIYYQLLSSLRWLVHFDILELIPLDSIVPYPELAATAGVPEFQLKSVIRMAITSNFLCEPISNQVAHNPVSALFASNSELVERVKIMTRYSMPSAAAFADATAKWGVTDEKNQTAFNVALDTNIPVSDFITQSSELANRFARYMRNDQFSEGTSLRHLSGGFDWEGLGKAKVVEVGSSIWGSSSIVLAQLFPKLTFVVQLIPKMGSNRGTSLPSYPDLIHSRIRTQVHDLFTSQPLKGADVYILRMMLHDWSSTNIVAVLKAHLEALKSNPRSRLLIMDIVLLPPGSVSIVEEALLRARDLALMQVSNGKERELDEFAELVSQAYDQDGSLKVRSITKPPGSVMTIMDVHYQRYSREEYSAQL